MASEEDDIMPGGSTGYWGIPREPKEQAIARKKEQAEVAAQIQDIKRVIRHIDERIEFRDKIDSITVDVDEDPELHQKAFAVNKLLKEALLEEKQLLVDLLETHDRMK